MIMPFKKYYPFGGETNFEQKILSHEKIHTLRESNRWRPGMIIHFYMGMRTKQMRLFKTETCKSTQRITIRINKHSIVIMIDGKKYIDEQVLPIISNDGLTMQQFKRFFTKNWKGYIVHWTDYRY